MDVHIAADTPRTTECGEDVIDISGTVNKIDHLTGVVSMISMPTIFLFLTLKMLLNWTRATMPTTMPPNPIRSPLLYLI